MFSNTAYLDRTYSSPRSYEAIFFISIYFTIHRRKKLFWRVACLFRSKSKKFVFLNAVNLLMPEIHVDMIALSCLCMMLWNLKRDFFKYNFLYWSPVFKYKPAVLGGAQPPNTLNQTWYSLHQKLIVTWINFSLLQ